MASYPWSTPKQKFLEESYTKERDTRLQWYFKNVYGKADTRYSKQVTDCHATKWNIQLILAPVKLLGLNNTAIARWGGGRVVPASRVNITASQGSEIRAELCHYWPSSNLCFGVHISSNQYFSSSYESSGIDWDLVRSAGPDLFPSFSRPCGAHRR